MFAIVLGAACAATIVITTDRYATNAGQLAGIGLALFVVGVLAGSSSIVAFGTLPMLGAAMIEIGANPGDGWIRAAVVGSLWFVSLEMAWDAIERRDGHRRSKAVNFRRMQEVSTVVVGAFAVPLVVLALVTAFTPQRTLAVQALVVGGLAVAMISAIRHLAKTV